MADLLSAFLIESFFTFLSVSSVVLMLARGGVGGDGKKGKVICFCFCSF